MILDLRFWILDWGRTRMKAISSARVSDCHSDNRKSKIQNPKWSGIVAFVVTLAMAGAVAQAQQPGKVFRIGFLDSSTAAGSAILLETFRQELGKLGWIEGKNIIIEYRFSENKGVGLLPELAADLARLKVDL